MLSPVLLKLVIQIFFSDSCTVTPVEVVPQALYLQARSIYLGPVAAGVVLAVPHAAGLGTDVLLLLQLLQHFHLFALVLDRQISACYLLSFS